MSFSAQDVALQLVLLACSEMLFSGLQGQFYHRRGSEPRSRSALLFQSPCRAPAMSLAAQAAWGGSRAQETSSPGAVAGSKGMLDPSSRPRRLQELANQPDFCYRSLALAEWFGVVAIAASLVLECLLRRDEGIGEGDTVGRGMFAIRMLLSGGLLF